MEQSGIPRDVDDGGIDLVIMHGVGGLGAAREEDVTSPTFTLVHRYEGATRVYHVDLYRVANFNDLETLGLEDVFSEKAVILIEWPDRMTLRTDWPVIRIDLEHVDENTRRITVVGDDMDLDRGQ